ncbi:MAG: hypothetical protein COA42_17270, partial [Alteromonadaceae bacterium]
MKKISLSILAIAIAYIGASFYGSHKTKSLIEHHVSQFNTTPGYTTNILSYEKGLLSSKAIVNVSFELGGDGTVYPEALEATFVID